MVIIKTVLFSALICLNFKAFLEHEFAFDSLVDYVKVVRDKNLTLYCDLQVSKTTDEQNYTRDPNDATWMKLYPTKYTMPNSHYSHVFKTDNFSWALSIEKVALEDSGFYMCLLNSKPRLFKFYDVTVMPPELSYEERMEILWKSGNGSFIIIGR